MKFPRATAAPLGHGGSKTQSWACYTTVGHATCHCPWWGPRYEPGGPAHLGRQVCGRATRWMRHQQGCATKMRRSQRDQQTRGLRQDDRCQCDQNGLQVTELEIFPQYIQETPAHKSHALLSEAPSSGPADQLQPRPVLDWRPLSPLQRKTWDLSLPGDTTRGHLGATQVSDQLKILLLDIHNVGV